MPPIPIEAFGTGRVNSVNQTHAPVGSAADSLNLTHETGNNTAKRRDPIDRVNATEPAVARVLNIFEFVNASLATTLLAKVGSVLYTWSLTPSTAMSSIKTGLDATHSAQLCTANGIVFIADWAAANYTSDGTSAGTNALQEAAPTGAFTLASAGAAVGNAAGTVKYSYSRQDLYSAATGTPSASVSVTRTVDQGVTVTNATLDFTTPWTKITLYRTKAGGSQMYRVTTNLTAASFPYADTSLDSALTKASTVHDENGVASIEKPEAAKYCAFFRGRLFLANLTGKPNRIRWSRPIEPTQFENTTTANFDVGLNDGGEITGIVELRGSLVVFKNNSIWVLNGDADETTFTIYEQVPGKGCIAPWTIRRDGDDRIFFLSAHGVLTFDLQSVPPIPLSQNILADTLDLNVTNRAAFFCAGINQRIRSYELSVSPTSVTTNSKTHVFFMDTGAWGRKEYAMGQITPAAYSDTGKSGPVHNANGLVKLYLGDENGYVYETDVATGADGVTSGTKTGVLTGATATTSTIATAAFRTTGNGLKKNSLTLRRAADNTYETVLITNNTATVITHASWVGTAAVVGDTIFVGAFQATLALNRLDLGTNRKKRWERLEIEFQKQTHTIPLRIGYTIEGDTAPTASVEYAMNNDFIGRLPIHRRAIACAPYFDIIGTDHDFELLRVTIEAVELGARLPTR